MKQETRRLASGATVTYYYAWRGGPRLTGEPGSAEFIASYHAAHQSLQSPNKSVFFSIIAEFKASRAYTEKIAERTRHDYARQIAKIEEKFGTLPIAALDDPGMTRVFRKWRDSMAASPRQADYAWTVLMRILSWARGEGLTSYRPPEREERLYHSDRSDKIWTDDDIAKFMAVAPISLQRALVLAADTGQRQGDLLILPWSGFDGERIRLKQSKGGRRVSVPVTRRLRAVLENTPRISPVILVSSANRPWKPNAFRNAWADATRKAGVTGLTFHDLRGTAVTRLAAAGCTNPEIATITGHSLRDVGAILDKYLARTDAIADMAIAKLERFSGGRE